MKSSRFWLTLFPLIAFIGLAFVFWRGLSGKPSEVPSVLIGKPAPEFTLAAVEGLGVPGFSTADLRQGKVTVVNIWASWCGPCRQEHPYLMELSKRADIRVIGINNKDEPENARRFLGALGQPFSAVGADKDGRVSIDWGAYGVPETFIVDGKGIIRYKLIGGLTAEALAGPVRQHIEAAKSP